AQHAYGIAVRSGSSDIHVEANYVSLDANFEWVFGIATDRAVHDVTVTGNYVNAYTSGTFHTGGIHLGDTYVDDASRATGIIVTRNTVVNATAGGIVTASAVDTVITGNLVSMDYPGRKTLAADASHGIDISEKSDGAIVVGNVIHTFQWGILLGSDNAQILSNTIFDVDYAIYVPDSGSLPGVSSSAATVGAAVAFATASTEESQTLQDAWTGSVDRLQVTGLSAGKLTFELQSASDVAFEGTGFTPDAFYTLTRSGADGQSPVLTVQS